MPIRRGERSSGSQKKTTAAPVEVAVWRGGGRLGVWRWGSGTYPECRRRDCVHSRGWAVSQWQSPTQTGWWWWVVVADGAHPARPDPDAGATPKPGGGFPRWDEVPLVRTITICHKWFGASPGRILGGKKGSSGGAAARLRYGPVGILIKRGGGARAAAACSRPCVVRARR